MDKGIVLQTQFATSSMDNLTMVPISSGTSLQSVTKKKNQCLKKYGPFTLLVLL
ncbi:unnamed protein product, partial [Adineta steineri]